MELFANIFSTPMSLATYLISGIVALFCGLFIALASSFKQRITKSFFIALVVIPLAVQTVILMVNGSVGTGIAVAGAFSLVRFRSVPGKAKDIVSVFLAMTAGITCSSGFVGIGVLFTIIACAVIIAFNFIKMSSDKEMELKITVPENLNFTGAFDSILNKYTQKYTLSSVKTTNMGSLFRLTYKIEMKNDAEIRNLIDDLRVKNGNLEISVMKSEGSVEEL